MASSITNVTFICVLLTLWNNHQLFVKCDPPKGRKISPSDPIIETVNGPVRGMMDRYNNVKVSKFYGIPYAMPPVGNLRFRKSRQMNYSWLEPLVAFEHPNSCFQGINVAIEKEVGKSGDGGVSEDCLYLNIFAPGLTGGNKNDQNKELKAVMVWVHGGNFYGGSISQPTFDGKALAVMGDIVVVTMNYRIGTFGYLYTGASDDDAPGNQALWDVLNAVYWVNKNIKKFGGDPSKVTLAGHGSGAVLVSMAAMSPAFDQLLKSWIIMSGPAIGNWIENKAVSKVRAHRMAYAMGCSSEEHLFNDCFKTADAHLLSLVSQSRLISPSFDNRIYNYFNILPQFGDSLVPMHPSELVKLFPKTKRILIGATDFEGSPLLGQKDLLTLDPRILRVSSSDREATWKSGFRDWISKDIRKVNESTIDLIVDYYFAQSNSQGRKEWAYEVLQFWGEHNIMCPTRIQAELMSENLNDVFLYRFSHMNNATTTITACKGYNLSCHGMEVPLLFANPFLMPDKFDAADKAASTELIKIFSGFVRGETMFPKMTFTEDSAYTFGPKVQSSEKTTYSWNKDICNLFKPFILLDNELEQEIAADTIGMRIIQSPFGIPGRLTNRIIGIFISYSDRIGYSLLPWGRYFMDMYTSLAEKLNQAPSLSELIRYLYSFTGITMTF